MSNDFAKTFPRVALFAVCLVAAVPACAQSADPMEDMKQSCAGDYFRLCAGADPYGDAVRQCFAQNRARLSKDCRVAIDAYHKRAAATGVPQ